MPKRPVELPWSCMKCGICCRITKVLLMTKEEREVILNTITPEEAAELEWREVEEPTGFWMMKLAPCPFLTDTGCSIHPVRPYNCRRFFCYRTKYEPYEVTPDNNCKNLLDRLVESREVRRDYALRQRKAQRWARAHGWKDEQ